jgi:exopolysaccharide biosynthesis polyprenyl glycosylphosphotransferase
MRVIVWGNEPLWESMKHVHEERQVLLLYFFTDLALYWLALVLSTLSRMDVITQIDFFAIQRDRLACVFVFAVAAIMTGIYRSQRVSDRFDAVYYGLIALFAAGIAQFVLTALLPADLREITRRELIISLGVASVFLTIWHYFAASLVSRFRSLHRFFYVVGSPEHGEHIVREITRRRSSVPTEARYVSLEDFQAQVAQERDEQGPDYVPSGDAIITLEAREHWKLDEILLFCREHCRRTFLYPSVHDVFLFQHHSLLAIAGIPLIEVASRQFSTPYLYIKRCIDVAAAVAGLLGSLPICLATALAIKFTSPGPVFYSQERLGKNGKPFRIYKFRSMVSDVELRDETGHILAQENDPRITSVGRFIRKHRIDELPQLWNVLKGDMSLIGPRPAWREFYELNRSRLPLVDQRLAVRPGLTCLSHVLGSYASEAEDRLNYDLIYISTLSLMSDLRIWIGTIRIVLSGKGAQ